MTAYGVALLVSFRLIRRNRVLLGMQILLIGMGLGLLALNLLIGGLGILLGIAVSLLITAIATLTLPERVVTPAIIISFGLGLFIVLLDTLLPAYRLLVPALNVYVPGVVVVLAVVCIYLIVRQFGSFSMRGKLSLTLLLVAIVPVILQAVAFTLLAQSRLTSISQQDLLSSAKQTAGRINRFIDDGLLDVRSSTLLLDVIDLLSAPADKRDTTKVAAIFDALSGRSRYIQSYAVFDTTGIDVFDTSRSNIGTNQLNRPYIQNPLQTSKPYVSDVLFDQVTGEGLLHFSAPVRAANGDLIGIAEVAYSVTALQDLVAQSSDLKNTGQFGLLFDENHFRLADGSNTTDQLPFKLTMPLTPEQLTTLRAAQRLPAGDITKLTANLPDLDKGLQQATQQSFFVAEAGETVNQGESSEAPDQMAVFKLGSRPWLVVFGETQSALLSPVTDLARSSLFLVLAISAVTIFIAARVSRALARPILSLNEAAGKVAQGDLSVRAIVNTADETGLLAATFNSMTEQLGSMVTTLEDRVQARTEQLRASAEVGHAATSILNPDQLLKQVVDLITARFGFYYTAVFVVDEENQQAVLRAATGEAGHVLLERGHRLPLNGESMVGTVIATSLPKIALDMGEDAVRFVNPLLPKTRSEIALPLRVGDRNLGALDVQSEQADAFDESNAEALQAMADQIAVALFNAETFNRSEQQARSLAKLNQLSRELAQAATRESVAFAVAQAVVELMGPNRLALVETTPNPQLLSARTLWPDANRPLGEPQPIPASSSLSGECLKLGERIYIPDSNTVLDKYEDVALTHALGVRSNVAIPLRIGERVIGTFNVASDRLNAYTPEQLSQLEQVAAQVAVTLDSLNLTKQTQQALTELDAANRRLMGQVWSTYTQSDRLVAAEWRNGEWITTHRQGLSAKAAQSQALVSAASAAFSPQAIKLPIKVRGATIGEFSVAPDQGQADWNSEEVAFAQALIDQVGQVLENARLLEDTERSAQREKAVAGAADKIHRATDIETVLQSAITELNRITGRSGISIQLGFGHADVQRNLSAGSGQRTGQPRHEGPEGDR